jgi:two-component system sensor histidine kinase/response regulator
MTADKKTTILLVDDKPGNILVLKELLEKEDRQFLEADNGSEGLKIALSEHIDLIILDVQMPGMDGFEVAQILKSNKRTQNIPIIFASAEKKEHHSILKGFEEGAVDYLFKPLDPGITKAKVSVLLQLQQQKKELVEKNRALETADQRIRELNADLQNHLQQLELINKELESFSYSISHDLRAPLRSIHGYAKILEEDYKETLDDEAKRLLTIIQQNADKMGNLINSLLELSRLGRKEVRKTTVDTDEIVQAVIRDINSSSPNHAHIICEGLPTVQGDYTLLTQVFFNLISNAVKYSSKKEKPVIEIKAEKNDKEVLFYVKDNGAGFNMQYADKLFGVFQRLHTNDEFEGVGVGLAIIQRIVHKFGGKVWADAKKDEGATFYFTLPD